jgi:protocatechuate 3,4-dioxygenase beta subunit
LKATRLAPLLAGALAISALGGWAPAHADTDSGYLVGTVTDAASRPLADAAVTIFWCDTVDDGGAADADGCYNTVAFPSDPDDAPLTDRNGRYVAEVPNNAIADRVGDAGSWRVRAARPDFTAPATTAAVTLTPRANTAAAPITLTAEAADPAPANTALTGVVTDSAGVPLAGAFVQAVDATGRFVDDATTGTDGRYYFPVDDPAGSTNPAVYAETNVTGSVKLRFSAPGHVPEWYDNTPARSKATAIPVAAYPAATPAQAPAVALAPMGTLTGTVKLPASAKNWEAGVTVYDLDGNAIYGSATDATGAFSVDVNPGTYYVRADGLRYTEISANDPDCATCVTRVDFRDFVAGYYGGGTSLATAKRITVKGGAAKSAGTIKLSGSLKAVEKPEVKGKLVRGQLVTGKKVKVTQGTWNRQSDIKLSYVWKVGSKTLSKKSTLNVTKKVQKKIGKKLSSLTVTVTATDRFGELVDGKVKIKVKNALMKSAKK